MIFLEMCPNQTTARRSTVKIFCCSSAGYYEELCMMDPYILDSLFQLSSQVNPDCVSAFHVLRPRNRTDNLVVALTISGTVRIRPGE